MMKQRATNGGTSGSRYDKHNASIANNEEENLILKLLPSEVISNLILAQFCTGKAISTFAFVLEGCKYSTLKGPNRQRQNQQHHQNRRKQQRNRHASSTTVKIRTIEEYFDTSAVIREALLCRFGILLGRMECILGNKNSSAVTEIQDVLEFYKAETCIVLDEQSNNDSDPYGVDVRDAKRNRVKYVSSCCAVIDYFEQMECNRYAGDYVVWIGPLDTSHGIINSAVLTCSDLRLWTVSSLLYWYNDFELYEYKLVTPYTSQDLTFRTEYGSLRCVANDSTDYPLLKQICHSLNDENDPLGRFSLVPRHLGFENAPSLVFTKESKAALKCYWNPDDIVHYDWEDSLEEFAPNAIRIMNRWKDTYQEGSDFSLFQNEGHDDDENDDWSEDDGDGDEDDDASM